MLRQDHSAVRACPVSNQPEEVRECVVELGRADDREWYNTEEELISIARWETERGHAHRCGHDREYVSRYDGQEGHEYLEREAEGVECGGDIGRDGESHEHSEEFPKVPGWA